MYRKRERTQNWTLEEKKYLLELVKFRLDVLENKRIDSASSALKGIAWQDIHASFAARFGNDRDAHRVREQWRRMKGQTRTEMMEFADRVRTYGAAVANQHWPSPLAEEVWKALETARSINEANQGYGPGDDVASPVTIDDDEEDGDNVQWDGDNSSHDINFSFHDNGIKTEPPDFANGGNHPEQSGNFARADRGDSLQSRDFHDHDASVVGEEMEAAGLISMLRPKVELNDVPDLYPSTVPSGLSITAVKGEGSCGLSKRRLVERHELSVRPNLRSEAGSTPPTSARPAPPLSLVPSGTPGVPPGRQAPSNGNGRYRRSLPSLPPGMTGAHHLSPSAEDTKTLEQRQQRRRMEMLEEEHGARMELLSVEKATAEIRRRIALSEEAAGALTCRSCGADKNQENIIGSARRRQSSSKSDVADQDFGEDHGVNDASLASTPSPSNASRSSIENDHGGTDVDQVRFAGGLGEPGSGAGKGGGAGGSIREAGGSMGKREAAFEDEYFYKQQKEQLKKLKADLADEIGFHEEQIKRHQEAISRHKQRVSDLDKDK